MPNPPLEKRPCDLLDCRACESADNPTAVALKNRLEAPRGSYAEWQWAKQQSRLAPDRHSESCQSACQLFLDLVDVCTTWRRIAEHPEHRRPLPRHPHRSDDRE